MIAISFMLVMPTNFVLAQAEDLFVKYSNAKNNEERLQIYNDAKKGLDPTEFARFNSLLGGGVSTSTSTKSTTTPSTTSSSSKNKDPYKNILGDISEGLGETKKKDAGVFKGVTVACFDYGQCTLCDILVVLIEISNIILRLFVIIALVFFIYGAGYLMFSSGNESMVTKGKGIIRATIIGSVIVMIAWQLIAYIAIVLANGSIFAEKDHVNSANPVAGWYEVASKCKSR